MTHRVLHLITRFVVGGGAEKTTLQTLEALHHAERDYDIRLGFGHEHEPDRVNEIDDWIETVKFDMIRHYDLLRAPLAVLQVAKYLRTEQIDLLHTHGTEAGIIGRWAAFLANTPVVIHEIHGVPFTRDRNPLLNKFIEVMERISAPLATILIVKSKKIRDEFLNRGIGRREQYELIYHGVDIDWYREADSTFESVREVVNLLFIGRLVEGKGLFDLLEAFERLSETESVRLWIVGDGPLRESLQTTVDRRGLEDVRLLGYREDVSGLLASADVFVLPSYREGTPRVITEALAAGVPVVSTRIAGIPEQVDHGTTGYLYEPGNIEDLERYLGRLVASANRRERMGSAAAKDVNNFSLDVANERFTRLYDRLLSAVNPV